LLFPSTYHAVLAFKGCVCPARLHPRGRLRPLTAALHRGVPALAGLHARHPAAKTRAGGTELPRRAVHGTPAARRQLWCRCGACGKDVNSLVLLGVGILVLLGVALSCYQEYGRVAKPLSMRISAPLNLESNLKSIKLTIRKARTLWINRQAARSTS
jgi:hypothetical protein